MAKRVKRAKAVKSIKVAAKMGKGKAAASSVAERAMPGWKAVRPSGPLRSFGVAADGAGSGKPEVDAVMPSTEALHRKFFGSEGADAATPPVPAPAKMLDDHVEVVEMKSGDLQKSVGVNAETEKVEWSQG
jgi:hypothetical protein